MESPSTAVPRGELAERRAARSSCGSGARIMARALALLLAALTVAADAARPRPVRALAVRGGS